MVSALFSSLFTSLSGSELMLINFWSYIYFLNIVCLCLHFRGREMCAWKSCNLPRTGTSHNCHGLWTSEIHWCWTGRRKNEHFRVGPSLKALVSLTTFLLLDHAMWNNFWLVRSSDCSASRPVLALYRTQVATLIGIYIFEQHLSVIGPGPDTKGVWVRTWPAN